MYKWNWPSATFKCSSKRRSFKKTMPTFQVGSSISMTYISGQPIVFVGTGQTYTDLKSLNAKAVVTALMK